MKKDQIKKKTNWGKKIAKIAITWQKKSVLFNQTDKKNNNICSLSSDILGYL